MTTHDKLTEEDRSKIIEAAYGAFRRSQRGVRGQAITEWAGIESWVVDETAKSLDARRAAQAAPSADLRAEAIDALEIGKAYVEQWVKNDGGIDVCDIEFRTDFERIAAVLAALSSPAQEAPAAEMPDDALCRAAKTLLDGAETGALADISDELRQEFGISAGSEEEDGIFYALTEGLRATVARLDHPAAQTEGEKP